MVDKLRTSKVIEVRSGESVAIDGGRILLVLEDKSGRVARLRFEADSDVSIRRSGDASPSGAAAMAAQGLQGFSGLGKATPSLVE